MIRLAPYLFNGLIYKFSKFYILYFILILFSPELLLAATPADIDAAARQAEILQRQEQDRQQRELDEVRRSSEKVDGINTDLLLPKIDVPTLGVACREIRDITITDGINFSASLRERINKDFNGRCLNVGDIERILVEITKYYVDRGFITTRAYLPPQDLSKGHLTIYVIEGVLEKIDVEDGDAKSISIENVFPGMEGDLLNLRDLEQGIDQINRLSSNNAVLEIQPGDVAGTSRVVIKNQPTSPYHFNTSVDNQGSESTGKTQLGLFAGGDNLMGYNDMLSLTHRQSIPPDFNKQNSLSDNLNLTLPYGYSTLYAGASYSQYDSPITLPSSLQLISSGSNTSFNIRLDRVIYRDQTNRASVSSTLTTKESKNYLGGEFLSISSRKLTVLDLDSTLNTDLVGGVLSIDLGYAIGLDALGALEDIDNLPSAAPHAQFGKLKAGFNFTRAFSLFEKSLTFTSQFTGQKASDTLFGSEQISIGGLYSVRGFVSNTLTGDHGYYWHNEVSIRHAVHIYEQIIPARFYLGVDSGKVINRVDNIPQGRLMGMVAGISGNWKKLSWDIFNTSPISLPDTMTKEASETWFRLTYAF